MSNHDCVRCPECDSCPGCAAEALDREITLREQAEAKRDEEHAGRLQLAMDNMALAAREAAAIVRAEKTEAERDQLKIQHRVAHLLSEETAKERDREWAEAKHHQITSEVLYRDLKPLLDFFRSPGNEWVDEAGKGLAGDNLCEVVVRALLALRARAEKAEAELADVRAENTRLRSLIREWYESEGTRTRRARAEEALAAEAVDAVKEGK